MHSTRIETRGVDPETSKTRDLSLQKLPKVSQRFSSNNFNSSTKTSQSEAVMDKFSNNGSIIEKFLEKTEYSLSFISNTQSLAFD